MVNTKAILNEHRKYRHFAHRILQITAMNIKQLQSTLAPLNTCANSQS